MSALKSLQAAFRCQSLLRIPQHGPRLQVNPVRALATSTEYGSEAGPRACFRCGETGHLAHQCPSKPPQFDGESRPPRRSSGAAAFGLGSTTGRTPYRGRNSESDADEGAMAERRVRSVCRSCGEPGHFARECPTGKVTLAACNSCGEVGHLARNCPTPSIKCHSCGEVGHYARECPQTECYACGELGHLGRDCTSPNKREVRRSVERRCFVCHQPGHMARDCPEGHQHQELD